MISFEDLVVHQQRRNILNSVSGRIHRGVLTGIIGPNGAGKSTLARALLGLQSCSGRIRVKGQDIKTMARSDLAKTIAYLPQGQILHWPLSVERLVSLGRLPHLAPLSSIRPADQQAIERAMEQTGVTAMRARDATQLSGGERARVMLARALACEAPVLIADEPLASLDPGFQLDVIALLKEQSQLGAAVVCVLHDLDIALRYCDRLILLAEGRILAEGTVDQVLTAANLRTAFGIEAAIDHAGSRPSLSITGRIPSVSVSNSVF